VKPFLKVELLDESRIEDRLSVCFGYLPDWKTKKLVEDVRTWCLRRLNDVKQFCYVAYEEGKVAGFVEFLPMKAFQEYEMNPCRMWPGAMPSAEYKGTKLSQIPYPTPVFGDDVFISCLWVEFSFTRRGIGTALIKRLVHDLKEGEILPNWKAEGIQVYIEKRRPDWHPSIDWPAGSVAFYEKMGFAKVRDVKTAEMTGYVMRRALK
jgi:ribosomal protein S18 acetylase RimI-like enzyme